VLYRNEKSSRESDTCGSTGFIENKQRERRDRTEMDQAAGATDQLLLESKSHGTKNARRERERLQPRTARRKATHDLGKLCLQEQ